VAVSKPPHERLRDAAALFEKRNAEYGDNYRVMGDTLKAMFPSGLTVRTEEEWVRIFLLIMCVMKTTRYAKNFLRGGHQDSLEDLSVYAQMAAETDEEARERKDHRKASEPMPTARGIQEPTPPFDGTLHPPPSHAEVERRRWLGEQIERATPRKD
jgi:hypothetical protein